MKASKLCVMMAGLALAGSALALPEAAPAVPAGSQLRSLGKPAKPWFKAPKDWTWPAKAGEAEICLWKDDKFAAASITIDDNCHPDHDWWLAQAKKYGFHLTWFVITDGVDGKNKGFNGSWEDWRKVAAAGHAVESHSADHKKASKQTDDELRASYSRSIAAIESNIPNHKVTCLAYPNGQPNEKVAAEYFIAARGTAAMPNIAGATSYLNTCGGGFGKPYFDSALTGKTDDPKLQWLGRPQFMRGWMVPLFHFVQHGRTPEEKANAVKKAESEVAYAGSKTNLVWFGSFPEVAKYGQERDSATLTAKTRPDGAVEVLVTDQMDDAIFNFPLTVKIRLPEGWKTVQAAQGGKPVAARLVEHGGALFALVDVVPDQGAMTIRRL